MNTSTIIRKAMRIFSLLMLCSWMAPVNSNGQFSTAAAYPFTASQKTFTYLTGGTPATLTSTDDGYAIIPIGFTFNYCNTPYTQVTVHSNGFMAFGSSTCYTYGASLSGLSCIGRCVMAGWHDGMADASYALTYSVTGSAPNRVFTAECKNWSSWSSTTYGPYITYQYILYEGGPIEIIYKQETSSSGFGSSGSATAVGLIGSTTDYQTLNNISTTPVSSSTTFTTSISGKPATGQSYLWGQIPCTGTPTTSVSGPNEVCFNKPFSLGLSGLSLYSGFTFQWQTSLNGTSWTNWTGLVSPSGDITDQITAPKYYRCIVTCVPSGQSFTTLARYVTIAPFYYCYCEGSKSTSAAGADIGNVKITSYPAGGVLLNNGTAGSLTNNANSNKTYSDFRYTVPPIPVYRDSSYIVNLTQINSAAYTSAIAAIFIDYNRNGTFDTSELVSLNTTTNSIPTPNLVVDTFTVSADTNKSKIGITGMRVVLRSGVIKPDTCATYPDGETEDYLVDIRYVPCNGQPSAGVITGDTSMCVGYEYTLTDSTYTKQRYGILNSWDISADAVNWTPLANTSNKDSITRLFYGQPLYYRLKSICTVTADTAFSTPHRVNLKPTYKCYCFSQATGLQQDTSDIGAFTIDKFDQNTGGSHLMNPLARYKRSDYTDVTPFEMNVDSAYNMFVYHTMPGKYHADAKITIFMDFDNDGVYEQPYERVYTGFTNVNTHTVVQNVVIPAGVIANVPTGMRVVLNNNLAPNTPSDNGCGTYQSGETEDYMVIFRSPFPSSVNDVAATSDVQLYPNPTQGRFNVSFSSNAATDVKIRVVTITGQLVSSETYSHNGGRFTQQLDMTGKAQGVYFVELEANGRKTKHKLVVQ